MHVPLLHVTTAQPTHLHVANYRLARSSACAVRTPHAPILMLLPHLLPSHVCMHCLATIAVRLPSTISDSSNHSGDLRQHHHRLVISTERACVSRRCANLAVIRRLTRQTQRPGGLAYASLQQMFRTQVGMSVVSVAVRGTLCEKVKLRCIQSLVQRFSTHAGCFIAPRRRILLSSMVTAAASAPAADAGNNVLGEAIRKTYGKPPSLIWCRQRF